MSTFYKNFLLTLLVSTLTACASSGPSPTDINYNQAIRSIESAKHAEYSIGAFWYPDALFGEWETISSDSQSGRLFVTPTSLLFAVYDENTNNYVEMFNVEISDIKWASVQKHYDNRDLRINVHGKNNSFVFNGNAQSKDFELSVDQFTKRVMEKIDAANL